MQLKYEQKFAGGAEMTWPAQNVKFHGLVVAPQRLGGGGAGVVGGGGAGVVGGGGAGVVCRVGGCVVGGNVGEGLVGAADNDDGPGLNEIAASGPDCV